MKATDPMNQLLTLYRVSNGYAIADLTGSEAIVLVEHEMVAAIDRVRQILMRESAPTGEGRLTKSELLTLVPKPTGQSVPTNEHPDLA
jgi:hypothetical protein